MQMDLAVLEISAAAVSDGLPAGRNLSTIAGAPIIEITLPEYDAAGFARKPIRHSESTRRFCTSVSQAIFVVGSTSLGCCGRQTGISIRRASRL